ncbi:MAG: 2-oxoacid:ferredoxin oxidoreductase subunit beta [Actinobacteria bacterium]|nr:2-oxoacid:ferredoxin oxidoreductase subunit beta [Actinomycetota bacterium]
MTESNGNKSEGNGHIEDAAAGTVAVQLTRKDFASDQEIRWCPGCGDYAVLAAVQGLMPELGVPREKIVFVSGIGCSSRFPYYMNTYGLHGIHGRAPALASGIALTRPDLQVWVVTGDGDALSIGGNHFIHTIRRNVNLKILLFNNEVYGLTKGQYSPTSRQGMITKSTPMGSLDRSFNPISLALGSEATFVARTLDVDRKHISEVLRAAASHKGSAMIEIYQNCNVFNDGAFDILTSKGGRAENQIRLVHGEKVIFGENKDKGIVFENGEAKIASISEVGEDRIAVHDAHREDPSWAFALSRLSQNPTGPTPMGVFRQVEAATYDDQMNQQLAAAQTKLGQGDLASLLNSGDTWEAPERRGSDAPVYAGPERRGRQPGE